MSPAKREDGNAKQSSVAVATDLSPRSNLVVERAARLARRLDSRLWLVHVFNDSLWARAKSIHDTPGQAGDQPQLAVQRQLATLAADLGARFGLTVKTEIPIGPASRRITEFAAAHRIVLMVVGERGKSWVRDMVLLGGTALKVAEGARVPVLLVRRPPAADYSKVLVATDFSASSANAARLASDLFPDADLTLLHAYATEVDEYMGFGSDAEAASSPLRDEALSRAAHNMEALVAKLGARKGISPFSKQLIFGYPATAILSLAPRLGTDLIVIGKHGGSPVGERLLGSVTQNVLYYADCDVLLVP